MKTSFAAVFLLGRAAAALQQIVLSNTDHDVPGNNKEQALLRNLEVTEPPIVPLGGKHCTLHLLQDYPVDSWYRPAVVNYHPQTACGEPGSWASIVMNLTVTSNGTQFDRLGSLSLAGVEIWRTSTAEPTKDGIVWTALKDVSGYSALFAQSGQLMFYEDNTVNSIYTGVFSTSLQVTFYAPTPDFPKPLTADAILPLSTRSKMKSQMLSYPGDTRVLQTVPNNTASAFVEVYASGNANEEFWYGNMPDSVAPYIKLGDDLPRHGPFREVQLHIDDRLVGVAYPFPVLYTGGANPLMWRPVASIAAFSARTSFVDITPFLGLLTDDKAHQYSFKVVSSESGHEVEQNWFVTGAIHVVLDKTHPPVRTTSTLLLNTIEPFAHALTISEVAEGNVTVAATTTASRDFAMKAIVVTGEGSKDVGVRVSMRFRNHQTYKHDGAVAFVEQLLSGATETLVNGSYAYADNYSFPLALWTDYKDFPVSFSASIDHGLRRRFLPPLAQSVKSTCVNQSAHGYIRRLDTASPTIGDSWSATEYSYTDENGYYFNRTLKAANSTITSDYIRTNIDNSSTSSPHALETPVHSHDLDQTILTMRRPGRGRRSVKTEGTLFSRDRMNRLENVP